MIDINKYYIEFQNEAEELLEEAKVDFSIRKEYIEKFKKYEIPTFIDIRSLYFQNESKFDKIYNEILKQDKYYYIEKSILKNIKEDFENDINEEFEGHIFIGNLRENINEKYLKIGFRLNLKWENFDDFERRGLFIELDVLDDVLNHNISQTEFIEIIKPFYLNRVV